MTLKSKVWPRSLSRFRTGRRSTCEPGRNALTPPRIVTERPPFTRAVIVPWISSSRSRAALISSHTLRRSAFSLERRTRPSSVSLDSTSTSTTSPTATRASPPGPMNSYIGMTPSDLYPMSTTTTSLPRAMTVPETISPSLSESAFATDSSNSAAKLPFLGGAVGAVTGVLAMYGFGTFLLGARRPREQRLVRGDELHRAHGRVMRARARRRGAGVELESRVAVVRGARAPRGLGRHE